MGRKSGAAAHPAERGREQRAGQTEWLLTACGAQLAIRKVGRCGETVGAVWGRAGQGSHRHLAVDVRMLDRADSLLLALGVLQLPALVLARECRLLAAVDEPLYR